VKVASLHDKGEIERFLRRDTYLHVYSLGDLDDFFWPNTVWYALKEGDEVREIVLLYTAPALPVMLALASGPPDDMRELLRQALRLLPKRIYAHLSPDVSSALESDYRIESHGTYYKMKLADPSRLAAVDTSVVLPLSAVDLREVRELYDVSYPGNAFDPRMLETGCYYGLWRDGRLAGVAGVHVYSAKYKVAALGNVVTHPNYRGQGIATATCAKLCRELLKTVDHIGLNVKADNVPALTSYKRLGFESIATYEECTLELK
jgi:ribosomal protein S18 acetylase RimI-like enzyme